MEQLTAMCKGRRRPEPAGIGEREQRLHVRPPVSGRLNRQFVNHLFPGQLDTRREPVNGRMEPEHGTNGFLAEER